MSDPCSYKGNWDFSQKTMPEVVKLLKKNAHRFLEFSEASREDDLHHATDYVIAFKGGKIAIRVRRPQYEYRDLTIRAYNNGSKTEIHKILEGFANYYFYGWTDASNNIKEYILVDLDKLRESKLLADWQKHIRMNRDGKTGFVIISPFALLSCDALIGYELNQDYMWGRKDA